MKFLKSASNGSKGFSAKFTNGESTDSHSAASFFLVMQDKGKTVADLDHYIRKMEPTLPESDWPEIKRIVATFAA